MTKKNKENSLSKVLGGGIPNDIPSTENLDFSKISAFRWDNISEGVRIKADIINKVLLIYELEMKSKNHFTDLLNKLSGYKYIMVMPTAKDVALDLLGRSFNVVALRDHDEDELFIGMAPDDTFSQLDEQNGIIQYQLGIWEF